MGREKHTQFSAADLHAIRKTLNKMNKIKLQSGQNTMEKPDLTNDNINAAAKFYVENNHDSEVRRMYGHHLRSFKEGAEWAKQALESRIKELEQENKQLKEVLTELHNNTLYQVHEQDDRTFHAPFHLFKKVDLALKK